MDLKIETSLFRWERSEPQEIVGAQLAVGDAFVAANALSHGQKISASDCSLALSGAFTLKPRAFSLLPES
jgi:flagella basal body P-ring formation protein FlgA